MEYFKTCHLICLQVKVNLFRIRKSWIFTDRVRSTREGNVFSLFTPREPGPAGGGVPEPGPARGVPEPGPARGYPDGGTQWGVPHLRYPIIPGWGGTPAGRYPDGGTPMFNPSQTWPGGYPGRGGVPHWVVLDKPRSVCLLRSCRRTFLFRFYSDKVLSFVFQETLDTTK